MSGKGLQVNLEGGFTLPPDIRAYFNEDRKYERVDSCILENIIQVRKELSEKNIGKAIDLTLENILLDIEKDNSNYRRVRWKIAILGSLIDCANGLQSEENTLVESSRDENRFYYDLIELTNGSHIPVTMIKPFWRDFFLKRKQIKTRDYNFFYCPSCGENSFYSFHSSGCEDCGFNKTFYYYGNDSFKVKKSDFEKKVNKNHTKKQRKKRFLLKSGLWVFKVKSYVKADRTKNKVDRDKVETFISTGEYQ